VKRKIYYYKHGVTIIEVLIAIAIVVMGLLGIAGLVMISGAKLSEGLRSDSMNNLALSAIQQIETRKLNNPNDYLVYLPNRRDFVSLTEKGGPRPNGDGTSLDAWRTETICFDPHFIAQQVVNGNYAPGVFARFPISSDIPMYRATIARNDGFNDNTLYRQDLFGQNVSRITNLLQSQEIYTSKDSLAYRHSDVRTELPQQQWIIDPFARERSGSPPLRFPMKRIGFGDKERLGGSQMSWMAMIAPSSTIQLTNLQGQPPNYGDPVNGAKATFRLSVVMFQNRILDYQNSSLDLREQTYDLDVSSGTTLLKQDLVRNNATSPWQPANLHNSPIHLADAKIKNGDWLLVSRLLTLPGLTTPGSDPAKVREFRWYRISYIDAEPQQAPAAGGIHVYKKITLHDFDPEEIFTTTSSVDKVQVTWLPRVIGVYEKTFNWILEY